MTTIIHSKYLREKPFFELMGMPGRLYLESFAFGDIDNPFDHLGTGGGFDLRAPERSPLTLFPDSAREGRSTLLRSLENLRSDRVAYPVVEQIGACSIGAEFKTDRGIVTTTIYLFYKCDLHLLRLFGANHRFQIEFGQVHKVGSFLTTRSW